MKICFVMSTPFDLGGEQRAVTILSNILHQKGHEVTILCTNTKSPINYELYNLNKDVKILFTRNKKIYEKIIRKINLLIVKANVKWGFLKNAPNILEKLIYDKTTIEIVEEKVRNEKFDIIIGIAGYFSLLVALLKCDEKVKKIGWQHSSFDAYFKTKGRYYWNLQNLFKNLILNLDKYVVLTEIDKKKMDNFFGINSLVINNPKSFVSDKVSNLSNKNFLIAGRFVYVKGYDLLIKAFSIFAKKNKDWTLTIVGDGEEKSKIFNLVRRYKIEDRVKIDNFTNDIKKYMLDASIYLLTSRWEGMPMVVLEAYEMGLPVISFDIDAMKELTNSAPTGIQVKKYDVEEFANAMLKLAEDTEMLDKFARNARESSKKYSYEVIGEKWEELLKNLK